jgi:hypothetical protein
MLNHLTRYKFNMTTNMTIGDSKCKLKLFGGVPDELYSKFDKLENFFDTIVSYREFAVPITGYGRPRSESTSLTGKDGEILIILQNKKTRTITKKHPTNWSELSNNRFVELYGPLSNDVYRFNMWLKGKVGEEKAIEYREKTKQYC